MEKEDNNNESNEIEQLIKKLKKLEIEQRRINKNIDNVRKDIQHIKKIDRGKKEEEERSKSEYTEYERSHTFEIGDKVKIKNTKQHNDNKGTVTGYTPTGYVKVTTDKGTKTRRIPLNLTIIKKAR